MCECILPMQVLLVINAILFHFFLRVLVTVLHLTTHGWRVTFHNIFSVYFVHTILLYSPEAQVGRY